MNKKSDTNRTEKAKRLLEKLSENPLLMEHVEAIVELVRSKEGPIGRADDVEQLLEREIRKLGKNAMQEWAQNAEERAAAQLQADFPTARCLKKSPDLVLHLRSDLRRRARLEDAPARVSAGV